MPQSIRPARVAESGGGFGAGNDIAAVRRSGRVIFSAISYYRKTSGREFPECPGKGAARPAPHSATGKAFFRPPVGIRRVRANAARNARCAGALPAPAVGSGEHSPIPPASPPTFPARWSRPRSAALSLPRLALRACPPRLIAIIAIPPVCLFGGAGQPVKNSLLFLLSFKSFGWGLACAEHAEQYYRRDDDDEDIFDGLHCCLFACLGKWTGRIVAFSAAARRGNVRGGRGASANPSNAGDFWGVECAGRVWAGDYPPRTFATRPGAIFARFAGSGFAAVRVRLARAAESGVGARREFPECPGKGRGKTIAPSATGKAFFRPPGRIRRVRGNATRWPRPRSATGSGRRMTSPRFAGRRG